MISDNASRAYPDYNINTVFTESFMENLDPRDIQSMPNLSKTTLNEEIDYDLGKYTIKCAYLINPADNYKLNESSKADLTPSSTSKLENSVTRFKSIKDYTKVHTEIQPKFMNVLNSPNKPVKTPELGKMTQ